MTNLFLPYNKTILKINVIFSTILSAISSTIIKTTSDLFQLAKKDPPTMTHLLLWYFIIWILTGGFFIAAFYFEITRKNEYYFYYNMGLSKAKLILLAYTMHILLVLPLLYILQYV